MFDQDILPGRPKILFVGNPWSSHVQNWINLIIDSSFNFRLFSCTDGYPPENWNVKTYLITRYPPRTMDPNWRKSWFPVPEEWNLHEEKIKKAVEDEKNRDNLIAQTIRWEQERDLIDQSYIESFSEFLKSLEESRNSFQELPNQIDLSITRHQNVNNKNKEILNHMLFELNQYVNQYNQYINNINSNKFLIKRIFKNIFNSNKNYPFSRKPIISSRPEKTQEFDITKIYELIEYYQNNIIEWQENIEQELQDSFKKIINDFPPIPIRSPYPERPPSPPQSNFPIEPLASKASTEQEWLAEVIRDWKPDIIHTFGLYEGSQYYFETRKNFKLESFGKWIIKVFGGSDLAFNIYNKEKRSNISAMFSECHHVIFDTYFYPDLLIKMKLLEPHQISPISPLPGSGGVNADELKRRWHGMPSTRRIIVWPKSYETIWSKAVPVLLALKNVWEDIMPCEIYQLNASSEIKEWVSTLPEDIKVHFHLLESLPMNEVLEIMLSSRVMLAPSLIDGRPNTMYEAMACGALPIVSPLMTIKEVVNEQNVLFADNLNQKEIEQAIIRAMKDDEFVDRLAINNLSVIKIHADINWIRPKVIDYYETLSA